ncbi:MAG: hypothetical protein BWX64_02695 [Acidobacteria bacterium ADurb.Bin051]|nr:MAG: hypothetical protein BWX64_02695 [Acidobacteria bacterium ADurb.Bin051]
MPTSAVSFLVEMWRGRPRYDHSQPSRGSGTRAIAIAAAESARPVAAPRAISVRRPRKAVRPSPTAPRARPAPPQCAPTRVRTATSAKKTSGESAASSSARQAGSPSRQRLQPAISIPAKKNGVASRRFAAVNSPRKRRVNGPLPWRSTSWKRRLSKSCANAQIQTGDVSRAARTPASQGWGLRRAPKRRPSRPRATSAGSSAGSASTTGNLARKPSPMAMPKPYQPRSSPCARATAAQVAPTNAATIATSVEV